MHIGKSLSGRYWVWRYGNGPVSPRRFYDVWLDFKFWKFWPHNVIKNDREFRENLHRGYTTATVHNLAGRFNRLAVDSMRHWTGTDGIPVEKRFYYPTTSGEAYDRMVDLIERLSEQYPLMPEEDLAYTRSLPRDRRLRRQMRDTDARYRDILDRHAQARKDYEARIRQARIEFIDVLPHLNG